MAENSQLPLALPQSPQTPRRGRPRGSGNRRSSDLAKYVAARFGGMTPGQQAAEVCMVTSKELRAARQSARELGMPVMMVAMARKAQILAGLLGCDARDAMLLIQKAQAELMPYVHQKRPQAEAEKEGHKTFVVAMPDTAFNPAIDPPIEAPTPQDQGVENAGIFDITPAQVSRTKSHTDP